MATPNESKLAAGTIVSWAAEAETPVYAEAPGITNIGAIGLMSEAKENTTLADTNKTYGEGLAEAPDKSVKGQFWASNTLQAAFITACKAKTPMLIKVVFPDKPDATGTGTTAVFNMKPLGFQVDEPTGGEWLMFTVNGKQNSDVTWTAPVAGV